MARRRLKLFTLNVYVVLVTAMRWTWYRVKIKAWWWIYNGVRIYLILLILHIYHALFFGMFSI
jgi:hypothetical protein